MLSRDFYSVFAAHGFATVTDITTAIETHFIPAADFTGGLELLVAPATGGASIIANTVSLLRALADTSGISPNDADRQLIHRLAHTTDGYHHLPKRCFDNLRGNLASAIATSTTAKERLIEIRPINLNIDDYLELLWQSGAWDQLETNPGRTPWLIEREIWRNTNS